MATDEANFDDSHPRRIVVLSGAGISAGSGLPTFRGPLGLWDNEALMRASSAATYREHLDELWAWWGARRTDATEAVPNPAHRVFAELEDVGYDVTIITQNVDGLHQRAGSRDVIELHGNLFRTRCCVKRCRQEPWDDHVARSVPPACPTCKRPSRLDIVLFGEQLDRHLWRRAEGAVRAAEIFVVVGTSGIVQPAAGLVAVAQDHGAYCISANTERAEDPTAMFDEQLIGPSEQLLVERFGT